MEVGRLLGVVALLSGVVLSHQADIKEEDDVLVLTTKNFDEAITDNKYILVEFYAPWCGHCKSLAPEYAKAAGVLKEENSEIRLAKVDATEEKDLGEKFQVQGFPTLKFFRNGKPMEYGGGRTSAEFVNWLKKKTGPPAKVLEDEAAVKDFAESSKVVVVGHFADQTSEKATAFLEVASSLDSFQFGISSESSVASHLDVEGDAVVLLKKFDEGRAVFDGEYTVETLTQFIQGHSLPLVVAFSDETAPQIFGGSHSVQLLSFISKESESFDSTVETLKTIAAGYRGKVLFVTIDAAVDDNQRILEYFQLKTDDVPTARMINLSESAMLKFVPESMDFAEETIKQFVDDVISGTIKPHLNSEDIPEDWDAQPVKVVVGKNFNDVVINNKKNIFIEFYAPWCGHCKQLAPIWDKVGEYFKDREDVTVAKMDASANEVEGVNVKGFPTISMYPAGDKATPMDFNGARDFDSIVKYIESGGRVGGDPPAEEEGDDEELDAEEDGLPEDEEELSDVEMSEEEKELQAKAEEELDAAEPKDEL